jgi:hypothetical protein
MLRRIGLLCVLAACACAAPTLPLPPPTALVEEPPDAMGNVTVRGQALDSAYVACLNERTEQGVITRADDAGAYSIEIAAQAGDVIDVWQFDATSNGGELTTVIVPAP